MNCQISPLSKLPPSASDFIIGAALNSPRRSLPETLGIEDGLVTGLDPCAHRIGTNTSLISNYKHNHSTEGGAAHCGTTFWSRPTWAVFTIKAVEEKK